MKKIVLTLMLISLFLSACTQQGVTQVTPEVISDKFEAKENFVVYLGLSYCSACKIFKSIVETVIKTDDLTVYYVEYDQEAEDNEDNLKTLVTAYLEQNETFPYSFPILFVVQDGKIIDQFSLQQTDTEKEFKDRLIKDGVLSE